MPRQVITEVDVSDWDLLRAEPAGLDEKVWLIEPSGEWSWLFKPVKCHERRQQGENWSEKLACTAAAGMLGLPAAYVDMARRHDRCGSISRNIIPTDWQMQHGAVLLGGLLPDYMPGTREHRGHTLANVREILEQYAPPPSSEVPREWDAFDVFAGYLVLDAWIANPDRHEENWAILRPELSDEPGYLASTYDHASSLGFNLLDRYREQVLNEQRVSKWAQRGVAQRFESGKSTTLVQLASAGLRLARPDVRGYWLDRLVDVEQETWEDVIFSVPGMSEVSRTFAVRLLTENRRRLLDEC